MRKSLKYNLLLQIINWSIQIFAGSFLFTNGSVHDNFLALVKYTPTNVICFYITHSWLVKKYFLQNKEREFAIGIVVLLLISSSIYGYFFFHDTSPAATINLGRTKTLSYVIFYSLFVQFFNILAGFMVAMVVNKFTQDDKIHELQMAKNKAELEFLKAQIHPHFLFNILNNLYSLALTKSDNMVSALLKVADLLRFTLYGCGGDKVVLSKEIKAVNDYISIIQLRYEETLKIDIETLDASEMEKIYIPPYILVPLFENAVKHSNIGYEENKWISLSFHQNKNHLQIVIQNKIGINKNKETSSGIGLKNIKKRLELIFPDNPEIISIVIDSFTFKITLLFPIDENLYNC